jgi:hypothetical protein
VPSRGKSSTNLHSAGHYLLQPDLRPLDCLPTRFQAKAMTPNQSVVAK